MSWKQFLSPILALQNRAKHTESSIHFTGMFDRKLLPSQLLHKLSAAKAAKALYVKAHRTCRLVIEMAETAGDDTTDIEHLRHDLEKSIHRVTEIVKILDFKASRFGIGDEKEEMPSSKPEPAQMEAFVGTDANPADDSGHLDDLKNDLKHSLKVLADIVEYMERPTLMKLRKEIDKFVNY